MKGLEKSIIHGIRELLLTGSRKQKTACEAGRGRDRRGRSIRETVKAISELLRRRKFRVRQDSG
jgi:hypothetical protein